MTEPQCLGLAMGYPAHLKADVVSRLDAIGDVMNLLFDADVLDHGRLIALTHEAVDLTDDTEGQYTFDLSGYEEQE